MQTHLNMRCKLLVQQVLTIFLLIYTFHQYNVPINLFCNLFTYYYGISLISFYIHNVPPCNFWLPGACTCSQSCDRCWQVSLGTAEILPAPLELPLSEAVRKIKWVSLMISCIGTCTTFNFAHCPKFYCIFNDITHLKISSNEDLWKEGDIIYSNSWYITYLIQI